MTKPPKSAAPSQSRSRPEKRKSGHFEKESSKLSPLPKRAKNGNNGKAVSTSQHTSPDTRLPITGNRSPATTTVPAVGDAWKQAFSIEEMSIITASSIQKKVTRAVDAIMGRTPEKNAVVELRAKGPATSKMITVVEIAKRQIGQKGEKWFQYNKVEQVLAERKEGGKNAEKKEMGTKTKKDENPTEQDGEDEQSGEEDFETMKTPFERAHEGTVKVRAVPVMTIYLTHTRIEELRKAYG